MNAKKITVAGFGACMISGFPFEESKGFYRNGIRDASIDGLMFESKDLISLPAFGIDRAEKYLKRRVLGKADIAVLQFASTDSACPLNRTRQSVSRSDQDDNFQKSLEPANALLRLTWIAKSFVSFIVRPRSNTALPVYKATLVRMLTLLDRENMKTIVIGPFVCGNGYSTRSSRIFSMEIEGIVSKFSSASFVNAYELLKSESLSKIVLSDGFHISDYAHKLIGIELAKKLREAVPSSADGFANEKDLKK